VATRNAAKGIEKSIPRELGNHLETIPTHWQAVFWHIHDFLGPLPYFWIGKEKTTVFRTPSGSDL
jgi:hypothetical protein